MESLWNEVQNLKNKNVSFDLKTYSEEYYRANKEYILADNLTSSSKVSIALEYKETRFGRTKDLSIIFKDKVGDFSQSYKISADESWKPGLTMTIYRSSNQVRLKILNDTITFQLTTRILISVY